MRRRNPEVSTHGMGWKSTGHKRTSAVQNKQGASTTYVQPSPNWLLGQRYAQKSIVTGVFGLFILGIILGPAAIRQARKAESFNVVAVFGKTLGIIDTIMGIAITLFITYKLFAPEPVRTWVEALPNLLLGLLPGTASL